MIFGIEYTGLLDFLLKFFNMIWNLKISFIQGRSTMLMLNIIFLSAFAAGVFIIYQSRSASLFGSMHVDSVIYTTKKHSKKRINIIKRILSRWLVFIAFIFIFPTDIIIILNVIWIVYAMRILLKCLSRLNRLDTQKEYIQFENVNHILDFTLGCNITSDNQYIFSSYIQKSSAKHILLSNSSELLEKLSHLSSNSDIVAKYSLLYQISNDEGFLRVVEAKLKALASNRDTRSITKIITSEVNRIFSHGVDTENIDYAIFTEFCDLIFSFIDDYDLADLNKKVSDFILGLIESDINPEMKQDIIDNFLKRYFSDEKFNEMNYIALLDFATKLLAIQVLHFSLQDYAGEEEDSSYVFVCETCHVEVYGHSIQNNTHVKSEDLAIYLKDEHVEEKQTFAYIILYRMALYLKASPSLFVFSRAQPENPLYDQLADKLDNLASVVDLEKSSIIFMIYLEFVNRVNIFGDVYPYYLNYNKSKHMRNMYKDTKELINDYERSVFFINFTIYINVQGKYKNALFNNYPHGILTFLKDPYTLEHSLINRRELLYALYSLESIHDDLHVFTYERHTHKNELTGDIEYDNDIENVKLKLNLFFGYPMLTVLILLHCKSVPMELIKNNYMVFYMSDNYWYELNRRFSVDYLALLGISQDAVDDFSKRYKQRPYV